MIKVQQIMGDLSSPNFNFFQFFLFTFIPNFRSDQIVKFFTNRVSILLIVKFFTNLNRKLHRFKVLKCGLEKNGKRRFPALIPLLRISVIIVSRENFLKARIHRFCASAILKTPCVSANLSVCPHFLIISIHFHFLLDGLGGEFTPTLPSIR